ncbi:rhodanese-like domain-containing protein [Actinopolymorpha alba]|uniref:rhodanese-like domain-containing protein n=1 Tax=Actinopolymorpha alba TaxID=533267 RepID=UPI0003A8BF26|nr:rhodanese-like domain-containing protein [Actinopolymorpha alba]
MPRTMTRKEVEAELAAGSVTVVDALPLPAYERRHLPGALNLTEEQAEQHAESVLPDKAAAIVAYSTDSSCTRGPGLAQALERLGYRDVRLYADGIEDWVSAGLPVDKTA